MPVAHFLTRFLLNCEHNLGISLLAPIPWRQANIHFYLLVDIIQCSKEKITRPSTHRSFSCASIYWKYIVLCKMTARPIGFKWKSWKKRLFGSGSIPFIWYLCGLWPYCIYWPQRKKVLTIGGGQKFLHMQSHSDLLSHTANCSWVGGNCLIVGGATTPMKMTFSSLHCACCDSLKRIQ